MYWDLLGNFHFFWGYFMGTGYNLDMPSFWIVTHSHVEEIIYKIHSLLEMIGHQRHALSLPHIHFFIVIVFPIHWQLLGYAPFLDRTKNHSRGYIPWYPRCPPFLIGLIPISIKTTLCPANTFPKLYIVGYIPLYPIYTPILTGLLSALNPCYMSTKTLAWLISLYYLDYSGYSYHQIMDSLSTNEYKGMT